MSTTIERVKFQQSNAQGLGDVHQQLNSIPNTIISLQYQSNKFLTFKVNEASYGAVLRQGAEDTNIALQCQIRGTTYTFTRDHLDQLSNRECRELLNQLGLTEYLAMFA
ncbi:MAG: hypothetical protein AB1589_08500 [Cyanobacteriota bacterium]